MFKGALISLLVIFFLPTEPFAQVSDSLWLREVEINAPRYVPSAFESRPDSLLIEVYRDRTLGESLLSQAGTGLRNYGPGNLSTMSLRGTAAAHTAVLWNGFNLQSMMNGQYDLNLISLANTDEIRLSQGASVAQAGSGAVGGIIHLRSLPQWGTGWQLRQGLWMGSFGQERSTGQLSYGTASLYSRSSWQINRSENNFPFENRSLAGAPGQMQQNARQQFEQLSQDLHVKSKSWGTFSLWLHRQVAQRQIPVPMTLSPSDTRQGDEHNRLAFAWEHNRANWNFKSGMASIQETIRFRDSRIDINESHQVRSSMVYGLLQYRPSGKWNTGLRMEGSHFRGTSPQYGTLRVQNRLAAVPEFNLQLRHMMLKIVTRIEQVDERFLPLIPTLLLEFRVPKNIQTGLMVGNVYRLPTFNDLYWSPGGNSQLREEWGQQIDFFAKGSHRFRRWQFESQVNAYHMVINRWIAWIPGPFFWYAENVNQVQTRGLQAELKLRYTSRQFRLNWQSQGQMGESIFSSDQDPDRGKQLPYVPQYSLAQSMTLQYGQQFITLEQGTAGWRFVDRQNRQFLSSYSLIHLSIGCQTGWEAFQLQMRAGIQNLLDERYEMLEYRPMPGRSFFFGLIFQFKQSNP